jgi:hypothetical protein
LKPLLYLEFRQFVNSLKNTLRSPKRLIPALMIGAGVFSWFLQTALMVSGASRPGHMPMGLLGMNATSIREMIRAGSFLFLCFGTLVIVFQAFSTGSLVFSLAHIDFLFPTPISRRSVLLIKLLRDYLKYTLWVAFFVTFTGAPVMLALNGSLYPRGLVSIAAFTAYVLFVINMAHTVNIVFTFGFERLKQAGKIIKLVLGLALASGILVGVSQFATTGDSYFSVLGAAKSPVIKTIFAPAYWCSKLVVAPLPHTGEIDFGQLALLWALAIGSFGLLMSRKENIYEPSLGVSVRTTRLRQAMRSGDATAVRVQMLQEKGTKRAGLLVIPPFGRGAAALLWKNLLIRYRMSWVQLLLVLVLPAVVVIAVQRTVAGDEILQNLPFVLIYMAFLMSITVQPQVRAELKHANILKSMPISAWKVMLVQTLNGSLYLSAGILVFAASIWAFVPAARTDLLAVCAIGSVFLGFACVSATIIPALLYPDTRDQAQNFFCNLTGIMLISVASVPTIVLGVVLVVLVGMSHYAALIPICAVNAILGAAGVSISGAIFRRFDPTGE